MKYACNSGRFFESLLLHEFRDARILEPALALGLVAADMEVGIGENLPHLAYERVDELVSLLIAGVEFGAGNAKDPRQFANVFARPILRIGENPTGAVARHVELRHHADAARAGIRHHFAHLLLRVELTRRCDLRQARKLLALRAKALVVAQVPVKDVQLGDGHSIERPLDHRDRLEVAADIDHESAPAESAAHRRW